MLPSGGHSFWEFGEAIGFTLVATELDLTLATTLPELFAEPMMYLSWKLCRIFREHLRLQPSLANRLFNQLTDMIVALKLFRQPLTTLLVFRKAVPSFKCFCIQVFRRNTLMQHPRWNPRMLILNVVPGGCKCLRWTMNETRTSLCDHWMTSLTTHESLRCSNNNNGKSN